MQSVVKKSAGPAKVWLPPPTKTHRVELNNVVGSCGNVEQSNG